MKADTARLLRAVLRLIEDDVREWGEAVVEIDEREAAHYAELQNLDRRITVQAQVITEHLQMHLERDALHSVKVPS